MISGVRQETILGPILFIFYINDISTNITPTVKIYADDTKIYRTINEPDKDTPASHAQLDLHWLSDWADKWQLLFNLEKCEVMRASHRRDRSKPSYSLRVQLKSAESVKDLWATINYNLSWGKHVSYIVTKANKVLGVIKRSLGNDNRYAFSCFFLKRLKVVGKTFTRIRCPRLESPYTKKGYRILGKSPKKSITVSVKAKARRNDLWRPLPLTENLEKRREFLSLQSNPDNSNLQGK